MFINVLTQVLILLILIMLGFLLTKLKMLSELTVKQMTNLVLTIVTPSVIIKSFAREYDPATLKNLLVSFAIAIIVHLGYILFSRILIRDKNENRQKVLQFSTIFSNCAFMSIPLMQSLIGDLGVFYGTSFIAVFNIFAWSYGVFLMNGKGSGFTPKKIVLNPGIIGVTIGLIIYFLNIPIPKIIYEPISFMAALNTPLPMFIIGYHLANSNVFDGLKNLKTLYTIFIRLLLFPALVLLGMYLCGIKGEVLVACTICACAPTAAITTMFASKYGGDTSLSVTTVSLSTILSVITMPVIITLAQTVA